MQEREEKLVKLYESQQQRAFERVGARAVGGGGGSAGAGGASPVAGGNQPPIAAGRVRQMFDERRHKAGIDRSYPLEPLRNTNNRTNGLANATRGNATAPPSIRSPTFVPP